MLCDTCVRVLYARWRVEAAKLLFRERVRLNVEHLSEISIISAIIVL